MFRKVFLSPEGNSTQDKLQKGTRQSLRAGRSNISSPLGNSWIQILAPWNIPLSHLLRQETCTVRVYRLMSSHARDSSVERRKAPTFEVLHKSAQAWIVPTCTTTTTPFGGKSSCKGLESRCTCTKVNNTMVMFRPNHSGNASFLPKPTYDTCSNIPRPFSVRPPKTR